MTPDAVRKMNIPVALLPTQATQRERPSAPERALLAAVMEQALHDTRYARESDQQAQYITAELREWVLSGSRNCDGGFAFAGLCEVLELDVEATRSVFCGLLGIEREGAATGPVPRRYGDFTTAVRSIAAEKRGGTFTLREVAQRTGWPAKLAHRTVHSLEVRGECERVGWGAYRVREQAHAEN